MNETQNTRTSFLERVHSLAQNMSRTHSKPCNILTPNRKGKHFPYVQHGANKLYPPSSPKYKNTLYTSSALQYPDAHQRRNTFLMYSMMRASKTSVPLFRRTRPDLHKTSSGLILWTSQAVRSPDAQQKDGTLFVCSNNCVNKNMEHLCAPQPTFAQRTSATWWCQNHTPCKIQSLNVSRKLFAKNSSGVQAQYIQIYSGRQTWVAPYMLTTCLRNQYPQCAILMLSSKTKQLSHIPTYTPAEDTPAYLAHWRRLAQSLIGRNCGSIEQQSPH